MSVPLFNLKSRKRLWWIGIALVVLAFVTFFIRRKQEKPIEISTEKVERRNITQIVSATGKIQPAVEVKISAEVAGEIIELPFTEGQSVKKGELIAKIKPDIYQALVEQQEAALSSSQADNVMRKAQLSKAEQDLRRARDLFSKKISSDSDLSDAITNREVAEASYNASSFAIRRAEGQLSQTRKELIKTSIYSPIDGTISQLTSKLGERVVATAQFAGTEIMRVANLADMEVKASVNENDVVRVHPGDMTTINIDAWPDRKFSGKVKQIASTATVSGANTTEEVTNFEVKIEITNTDLDLRPGMSATVDIQTATVANVIAVPIQSVTVRTRDEGKSMEVINEQRIADQKKSGSATTENARADREKLQRVVFLKKRDIAIMKIVDTGLADNAYIEIKNGLEGGEEIISGSYAAISRDLKDGSQIEIEKPKKDQGKK